MTKKWRKLRKNVKEMIQIQRESKNAELKKKTKVISLTEAQAIVAKRKEDKETLEKELDERLEKLTLQKNSSSYVVSSQKSGNTHQTIGELEGSGGDQEREQPAENEDSDSEDDLVVAGGAGN